MSAEDEIEIELLPAERAILLRWTYPFQDMERQLKAFSSSDDIETVTISSFYLQRLIGDLCHAIAKRKCRNKDVIELCDRLEYIDSSGDGRLFDE